MINISSLGTILGVWAHPDDETFLTAGLMALAREAGDRVVCATATRGERGTDDPQRWPPNRLGRLRQYELAAALAALDVREHRWLDFVDGTCAEVPASLGVRAVRQVLDEVQPDTVITFAADGLTGHSDHRAVSRWVDAALAGTGRDVRLLHPTVTPEFAVQFAEVHDRLDVFHPSLPATHHVHELALHLRLTDPVLDRKIAAMRAHASQTDRLIDAMGEELFRSWWATESLITTPLDARVAA